MKTFSRTLRVWTALVALVSMSVLNVGPAFAGLTPSRTSGTSTIASARDADMLAAQRALENRIVIQKLQDYGVSAEDAQLKLASMSDQDLHTLASATKGLPSGGDSGTGAVIGVLVVIILVIVVLRLMNREVVVR